MSDRFDLETAIATWRRFHAQQRAFSSEDLDELERHLRDHMAHLVKLGVPPETALRRAVEAVGDYGVGEREYRKVHWAKVRRRGLFMHELQWGFTMLKSYWTIAWRNLQRHKGYALVNVVGLTLGLICFLLMAVFVQHELRYDRFHEDGDSIFRIVQQRPTSSGFQYWTATSPALANALVENYPEVERSSTVGEVYTPLLSYGQAHYTDAGIYADERFLSLFSFEVLQGDAETALQDPGSIVLTQSMAQKLFGDANPMGQVLTFQNEGLHTVTGVVADPITTSHLSFAYILPAMNHRWYVSGVDRSIIYNNGWYTYVKLQDGVPGRQLEEKFNADLQELLVEWAPENRMTFFAQPLHDIHLHWPQYQTMSFETSGNIRYVYFFVLLAVIVLGLACINYANLAVARSLGRGREVGMRKVSGASRSQILWQFINESVVMAALALSMALLLLPFVLPLMGELLGRSLSFADLDLRIVAVLLVGLPLLIGGLAGVYPAVLMMATRPMDALTGRLNRARRQLGLQEVLVVAQYATSVVLVMGSVVVYQQLQFVQDQDLGYDREQIVAVRANDVAIGEQFKSIRERWLQNPYIEGVSYSKFVPTRIGNMQGIVGWEGGPEDGRVSAQTTSADHDFMDVYGMDIIAGRGFSQAFATDTLGAPGVIINETAAADIGWTPEEALGKTFFLTDGQGQRTVIGVMADVHVNSVHNDLQPFVLTLDQYPTGYLSVKVRSEQMRETLAMLEETIQAVTPYPVEYQFMDDHFAQLYAQEQQAGQLVGVFTILALVIASMGLFGLAAYHTRRRTKEIGVRKVLGASTHTLIALLSADFLKLVLVAFVIAVPVSYIAVQQWLDAFTYRIDLGLGLFLGVGAVVLLVALATVSSHTLKTATADPVDSLRYE
ncbi:MAG: ABC transporter permease [Rhodothermales bacterium]